MRHGTDPFFALPWGATKGRVQESFGPLFQRLPPRGGIWFDGIWYPDDDPGTQYRTDRSFDLDGVEFNTTRIGFRAGWAGLVHRLSFVALEKTFGKRVKVEEIWEVSRQVIAKLSARYGDMLDGFYWKAGGNYIQRHCLTDEEDRRIVVLAHPIDERGKRAR